MARGDLTDAQWESIRRYVPVSPLGRLPRNLRKQIDGVNWRFRTGSPWRDVPERYGRWATVYDLHRRYCENGTWLAILLGILADAEEIGEIDWFVSVDSTTVRAHQHASGAAVCEQELQAAMDWLDAKANPANQKTNLPGQIEPLAAYSRVIPPNLKTTHAASSADAAGPGRAPRNSAAPEEG
ncbi:transposase [Actinospica durhamensis]|uniref:Transposase n=1 Tax=Actinospica durhamensis TaxID=1508375 RepID=A0A941F0Z2_9ACTN|nr:transposase [Actinospica durhamensis]MBR7839769.1 transposase [Actinospica durhamensis]